MKNKTRKSIFIWICILLFMIAIAMLLNKMETDNGITISGGTEGKDWEFYNSKILTVKSNQVTVSGSAKRDLKIECEGASQVTIKDLRQNGHKVYVFSTEDITLHAIGKNQLTWVSGWESVTICGTEGAELSLSENVKGRKLKLDNIDLQAEFLRSEQDLNITGRSNIKVKKITEREYMSADACIKADRTIKIDLKPGGSIMADGGKEFLPILADKKIVLGKNNFIMVPEKGYIKGEDTPYGPNCHFIFMEDGELASKVTIKNQ